MRELLIECRKRLVMEAEADHYDSEHCRDDDDADSYRVSEQVNLALVAKIDTALAAPSERDEIALRFAVALASTDDYSGCCGEVAKIGYDHADAFLTARAAGGGLDAKRGAP